MSLNQTTEQYKFFNGQKFEDSFLDEQSSIPSSVGLNGFSQNGFVDYNLQNKDCDFTYNPIKAYGINMHSKNSF